MTRPFKGAGVNPNGLLHYMDHLSPVCVLMDIPLIFDDPECEIAKKYYPQLNAVTIDYDNLTPEYLISQYDVLFLSDLWDRDDFRKKYRALEQKYNKTIRHVHCPHGYSDKGFYLKKCAREEITLVYGQNMLDMFKRFDVMDQLEEYVITGNYRYTYFKQHRAFFDKIVQEEILSKFEKKNPLILYAPTWMDFENTTTFFDATAYLLDQLPADYNMIIKLHPRLELDDVVQYYQILGKYEDKGNVLFLKEFPLVYPLLAHSDIYIGDTSSIGYDFLIFNKPMFLINKNKQTSDNAPLFKCGIEILPEDYPQIFRKIEKALPEDKEKFTSTRKELYHYTFGKERSFETIKEELDSLLSREPRR